MLRCSMQHLRRWARRAIGRSYLPTSSMQSDDVLVICADHGCDPTWPGSDHTREHIPVLVYGDSVEAGPLGKRESFADIGQSLASFFGLPPMQYGTSFLPA